MNETTDRQAFESYMRKLNPTVRLARQKESIGGYYKTTTVQRNWELWQAAVAVSRSQQELASERRD